MKLEIEEEGSFVIDRLEVFEVDWDYYESGGPCNAAKGIRAVAKSMFAAHFGSGIIEEVFRRHTERLLLIAIPNRSLSMSIWLFP